MSATCDAITLVEEAATLLDRGHTLAAGMLCRAALERSLADRVEREGLDQISGKGKAPWCKRTPARMLHRLVAVRAVEVTVFHELRSGLRILNEACHGQQPPTGRLREIVDLVRVTASEAVAAAEPPEDDAQIAFVPTEAEIAAACEALRATWSPREEQARRWWSVSQEVEIQIVNADQLVGEV